MSWKRTKHKDKQPGIEEKEGTMSRHLDAVATSTLHLKQLRHQLKRRKLSRQQFHRREGRDNTWLSRHPLLRLEVATTLGCRDINSTEKLSRQHQDVATTSGCRDNKCTEKRSRQHQAVATTAARTRMSRRQFQ